MPIPVAIDTDPGVDDAIALMLALRSPELAVELVTSVAGNVPVNVGTRNAKRLVALVNPQHWPVIAQGSAKPLRASSITATQVHGKDGLGGNASKFALPRGLSTRANGVTELVNFTRTHGSRAVIVALGPLTNIARAMRRAPKVMSTLGRLVIMGGAIRVPGNVSPLAEFNVFVDPHAADIVLGFGVETLLVPLDVTRTVRLTESGLAKAGRTRLAMAAKRIAREATRNPGGMPMHDPLAVAVAIDPTLVGTECLSVRVELFGETTRGMTVTDRRDGASRIAPGISVATSVDAERVLSMLEKRVLASRATSIATAGAGKVVVVGSANIDLSIAVDKLPAAGETVLGGSLVQAFGGKGANQAVAARRAGANVSLIARFGNDAFADEWLDFLAREGVDARACTRDAGTPSGVASITVSSAGENQIAVASGANMTFRPQVLSGSLDVIGAADVLLTQLEIPLQTVKRALEAARAKGVINLHNPAPARALDAPILKLIDILVCNEVEAGLLAEMPVRNQSGAQRAARLLRDKGIGKVVITLGPEGLVYIEQGSSRASHIAGRRVKALDTTGAGDTFVGYLATAIAQGMTFKAALELANKAAARSVTRRGAVPSIPYRDRK